MGTLNLNCNFFFLNLTMLVEETVHILYIHTKDRASRLRHTYVLYVLRMSILFWK